MFVDLKIKVYVHKLSKGKASIGTNGWLTLSSKSSNWFTIKVVMIKFMLTLSTIDYSNILH